MPTPYPLKWNPHQRLIQAVVLLCLLTRKHAAMRAHVDGRAKHAYTVCVSTPAYENGPHQLRGSAFYRLQKYELPLTVRGSMAVDTKNKSGACGVSSFTRGNPLGTGAQNNKIGILGLWLFIHVCCLPVIMWGARVLLVVGRLITSDQRINTSL